MKRARKSRACGTWNLSDCTQVPRGSRGAAAGAAAGAAHDATLASRAREALRAWQAATPGPDKRAALLEAQRAHARAGIPWREVARRAIPVPVIESWATGQR